MIGKGGMICDQADKICACFPEWKAASKAVLADTVKDYVEDFAALLEQSLLTEK